MFGIYVDGVRREKGIRSYNGEHKKAKDALGDAIVFWKANPTKRPEVIVRRIDGQRAVHILRGGTYSNHDFGVWERVGK